MNDIRISLTAEDFEKLVKGEIVEKKRHDGAAPRLIRIDPQRFERGYDIKIALQDIGWHKMIDIIAEAMQK